MNWIIKRISFILLLLIFIISTSWSQEIDILNYRNVLHDGRNNIEEAKPIALQAKIEYENNNFLEAKKLYIDALRLATNSNWYFDFGEVLFILNQFEQSEKAYELAALTDYSRKDFAYYNAACAASMRYSNSSLYFFELALNEGYSYWNHLMNDTDITYLRSLDDFHLLFNRYRLPNTLINIHNDLSTVNASSIDSIEVDVDGDTEKELIILLKFNYSLISEMSGSYYFALYKKIDNHWEFVNKTISNLISVPSLSYSENILENIRRDGPYIIQNLDNTTGSELLILSRGLTYQSGKILAFHNQTLNEVGEVEGLELIQTFNNTNYLIGHKITDFAFGDGTSEIYNQYHYKDGILNIDNLDPTIIDLLYQKKMRVYTENPNIASASSLFWFLYNYKKNILSNTWINDNFMKSPEYKYKNELLNIIRAEIQK
ncbi:hypothetical protein [Spirochaeta isovalerica]|uniref:Tetratricopeptide (TPR) repeat protein n=1 Tax=Spirochaeta isovalerica TaxID=150 RepID=A0A841RF50_9SPIO|nr:hypothetical protein [Spirochaeta isovalerica]MBB6482705.1 tetratricopeptide (TPR) repeat protein [Spirochaeta isovalerica]